jgi:CheY-like chemotaxis protein
VTFLELKMLSKDDFIKHLGDAYEHLYDIVYLRNHALTHLLIPQTEARKEKAWQLHNLLIDIIQDLNPGTKAPVFSREWRRHRLMTMRYIDGQTPQAVADQLNISRRHFYRELEGAIEVVAEILWERLAIEDTPTPESPDVAAHRMELLRLEAARFAQAERSVPIANIVRGAVDLLADKLNQAGIHFETEFDLPSPEIESGSQPLRQLMLALLGHVIADAPQTSVMILLRAEDDMAHLMITIEPMEAIRGLTPQEIVVREATLEELAQMSGAQLTLDVSHNRITGFGIRLPMAATQKTILVVDDNDDILELLGRYLTAHQYRVLFAHDAQQAIAHMQNTRPYAIVLDLMMPQMDGWDLLQRFLTQPDTQTVPIIICSVLKQKDLALSLGATAFIEKPISEMLLLSTLDNIGTN